MSAANGWMDLKTCVRVNNMKAHIGMRFEYMGPDYKSLGLFTGGIYSCVDIAASGCAVISHGEHERGFYLLVEDDGVAFAPGVSEEVKFKVVKSKSSDLKKLVHAFYKYGVSCGWLDSKRMGRQYPQVSKKRLKEWAREMAHSHIDNDGHILDFFDSYGSDKSQANMDDYVSEQISYW